MKIFILILFASILSNVEAQTIIEQRDYNFPSFNSLESTLGSASIGVPNGARWSEITLRPRSLNVDGKSAKIKIRYHQQQKSCLRAEKKLIFLLVGLRGSSSGGQANYYAHQLAKECFNVAIIPSVFTKDFVRSVSRVGYVGNANLDMQDLYGFLVYVRNYLSIQTSSFNSFSLTGYSLGALSAGFIGKIDERRREFNFKRVLLINTPVDAQYGIDLIDSYAKKMNRIGFRRKASLKARLGRSIASGKRTILSTRSFSRFVNRTRFISQFEKEAIIGNSFTSGLSKLSKTVADTRLALGYRSLNFAKVDNYRDYYSRFVLSLDRVNSLGTLNLTNSLPALDHYLRTSENVFLMHNADDFLLRKGDLNYLKNLFRDRFILFPRGGHLGNLWFPKNIKTAKNILNGGFL